MARLGKAYDSPRKQRFIGRVLADENQNVAAAARAERINPRSARKIWHKYLETGTTHRRPGSGRPSKLTPADKRLIVRTVRKNRRMPFGEVGNLVNGSATLVRNVLRPKGYHRRVAKRKPYLKPEHKDGRLSWARENANRRGWDDVAWSDESYIYLGGSRNRVFVTRRADEKYEEDCLIPTFTQSPIRVMVWGCVMQDRKGPLIALEYPGGKGGGMTGARYIAQVLEGAWKPFHAAAVRELGREVLFQQDGAPSHRAKVTQKWLRDNRVTLFSHPAASPDLSPIEQVWLTLKTRLRSRPRLPTTVEELKAAVLEEWDRLSMHDINRHIAQMPDRVQAVLAANGGHTKY